MRKLKYPLLIVSAVLLISYTWWLGRVAWLPVSGIRILHTGKPVEMKVYRSPDGLLAFANCDDSGCYTLDFAFAQEPLRLYRCSQFRDYVFFAIPSGQTRGTRIALDTKTEHDPKVRWASPTRVEFLDERDHVVWVDFVNYWE